MWESKGLEIASGNLHGNLGSREWGQEFVQGSKGFKIASESLCGNLRSQE